MTQPEIELEQAYVDRAYERLDEIVAEARRWATEAAAQRESAGPLRDSVVRTGLARAAQMSIGDEALVFGRTDARDGARLYIGRVGVYDRDYEQLVTDWRAPVAEAFYRATPGEPMGLVRRRHIISRGPRIVSLDDELLDQPAAGDHDLVLVGEGALLDALARSRTGRMRDIVSTIQAEQDAIIRAPMEGVLVVQGGPGTGKTAVGLHRAAYLLYSHRQRLERAGVLIVGPNPIFLRYIEQVLPSLGENATLATVAELVPGVRALGAESIDAQRIKGDPRMAKVIRRGVSNLQRPLDSDTVIRYESKPITITVAASREIVRLSRERFRGTHNERRPDVVGFVLQHLWRLWSEVERDWVKTMGEDGRRHFESDLRADPALRAALDTMWPATSGEDFVRRLFSDAQLLSAAAEKTLTDEELGILRRPRSAPLTEADVALVDEAEVHLGPFDGERKARTPDVDEEEDWAIERMLDDLQETEPVIRAQRRMFAERYRAARRELDLDGLEFKRVRKRFGHVIVDEAQGLSPMQWRMIARRCPSASMSVLGDLGQAGGVWAPERWEEVVPHVGAKELRVSELTINYRTPTEIMDVAAQVLTAAAPELEPPRSVRAGDAPVIRRADPKGLMDEIADAARAEQRRFPEGKVAVVAPPTLVEPIAAHIGARHIHQPDVLDDPVAVLSVDDARGLEFDAVIVTEPATIVEESSGALRALYVALTRATQRVVIVHAAELPEALTSAG